MTLLHSLSRERRRVLREKINSWRVKAIEEPLSGFYSPEVSPLLVIPQDPTEKARKLILAQYRASPNLIAYINVFMEEVDELLDALTETYTYRFLPFAYGDMLDIIGEIVGVTREIAGAAPLGLFGFYEEPASLGHKDATLPTSEGGVFYGQGGRRSGDLKLTDEELRRYIRARVLINTETPTTEILYEYTDLLYGNEEGAWEVQEGKSSANVHLNGFLSLQERAFFSAVYNDFKVAGVMLTLSDSSGDIELLRR